MWQGKRGNLAGDGKGTCDAGMGPSGEHRINDFTYLLTSLESNTRCISLSSLA